MHTHDLTAWTHSHQFDSGNPAAERGTRLVMWITAAMMIVEIGAGWNFNSMALLADGLHMSSHAIAIGLSAFAYAAARSKANDKRFAFGTWKIEILGGYTSAVFLLGIVALMVFGSIQRLITPVPIHFVDAIFIAIVGLMVNIVSAVILGKSDHHHHHHGDHAHGAANGHHDLNLKSAYVHVVADAATSVLAIAALSAGLFLGWTWLDPVMGLIGACVVAVWARGLLRDTGKVLLDREMDAPVVAEIREVIAERGADSDTKIADLHVWRVGKSVYSCAISLVTHDGQLNSDTVRRWLSVHDEIVHATVEVHLCA